MDLSVCGSATGDCLGFQRTGPYNAMPHNLFCQPIKLLLLGAKCVFKQLSGLKLKNMSNFHPLSLFNTYPDPQLQVGENLNKIS